MRFVDNKDGTILDTQTDLIWQQSDDGVKRTWQQAMDYAKILGSNWRLPTIDELFYLADRMRYNPSIDINYFPGCLSDNYWSSSTGVSVSKFAWFVYFYYGGAVWGSKYNLYYTRYVQGEIGSKKIHTC